MPTLASWRGRSPRGSAPSPRVGEAAPVVELLTLVALEDLVDVLLVLVALDAQDLARQDVTLAILMAGLPPFSFHLPNVVWTVASIGTPLANARLKDVPVTTVESWGIS